MEVGKKIKTLRTGESLNQTDFAKRINSSKSRISDYENGSPVPMDIIEKIINEFDVQSSYFFEDDIPVTKSKTISSETIMKNEFFYGVSNNVNVLRYIFQLLVVIMIMLAIIIDSTMFESFVLVVSIVVLTIQILTYLFMYKSSRQDKLIPDQKEIVFICDMTKDFCSKFRRDMKYSLIFNLFVSLIAYFFIIGLWYTVTSYEPVFMIIVLLMLIEFSWSIYTFIEIRRRNIFEKIISLEKGRYRQNSHLFEISYFFSWILVLVIFSLILVDEKIVLSNLIEKITIAIIVVKLIVSFGINLINQIFSKSYSIRYM